MTITSNNGLSKCRHYTLQNLGQHSFMSSIFWAILLHYQDSDYHGMDVQENVVQNLVGTKDLSLLPIIQTNYEDHPALHLMRTNESFPRYKVDSHEANSLSPPSAKNKNARCLISFLPYAFVVCTVTILLLLSRHRALLQIQ